MKQKTKLARKKKKRKKEKKENRKGEKMRLIQGCSQATNGGHCDAKKNQKTGLYELCVFSKWTEWKKECEGKSKKETIKFLQDSIMDIGLKMSECRKRIEKRWCNHEKKEMEINNIRQQIQKEIDKINCEIKCQQVKKEPTKK